MSDERFQFLYDFQVQDQKLERSARLLDQMNVGMERATRSLRALETASGSFGRVGDNAARAHSKVVDLSAALHVAGVAARGLGAVGGAAFRELETFGDNFIKAAGERTSTVRGYTTFLGGDKKQAELEFYRAQEFGLKTDFTSKTIEQGQSRLMAQGFRGRELYSTLFSSADLAAASPDDKNEMLKRITEARAQITSKGKLQGEELTRQLAEAGLKTDLAKDEIRKSIFFRTGKIEDIDKLMGAGKVSAAVAQPAIDRAILRQLHTTKAGEFASGSMGSVTSLLSNRDEAFANLSKSFDADKAIPAMGRYKKALAEETSLYDVNGRKGKDLALTLQDLANATTNAKAGISELTAAFMDSFSGSYAKELREGERDFDTSLTTGALHNLGEAIGRLGSAAADAIGKTNGLVANVAQRGANVVNRGIDLGEALDKGDWGSAAKIGLKSLWESPMPAMLTARNFLWQAEVAGNRAGIHSMRPDLMSGDTDDGLTKQYKAEARARDAAREDLGANKYKFKQSFKDKSEAAAALASEKKAKHEAGWNVLLTNYEPWFNPNGGMGGGATGLNALGSAVESSMAGSPAGGNPIVVNQQINITVPSSEIASRVAGEMRSARDTIAEELRTLSRAPRAAARH